jgi:carboxyl-terminal processing protease
MRRRSRFLIVAVLLVSSGALAGGFYSRWQKQVTARTASPNSEVTRNFAEAVRLVEDNYVTEADHERLAKTAIQGMLHALDPHSNFFDRREFNEMQEEQSSRFYGIGVTINERNGKVYVLGVVRDMPAYRAGLRYGDAIIAVDGKPTPRQSEALKLVRGEKGVPVEITVERAGAPQPITVKIVRDEVPYPSVRNHFMARPGVGYIALTGGFNQDTSEELHLALADLKKQGLTSLVLDLRRNPGGLLKQAIAVTETFLPRGTAIVSVRGREGFFNRPRTSQSESDHPETMPLVVLINGESASASEIVAGAIQDQDRGLIVGEDSFGKGLVQTVIKLPGGTGLTLTTAKYYTPSGRTIQREYNGVGLYDYYYSRYHLGRDGAIAPQPSPTGRTVYTPTGRPLHGGGGISPDITVKRSEEDLTWRDACFEFARQLAAGTVPGLEQFRIVGTEHGYRLRGNEYQVNEQVMTAFRNFLREHPRFRFLENNLSAKSDYARRRIRAEVITAAYGLEAADQLLLESDEQMQQAIEALPRARQLTETARLFSPRAERPEKNGQWPGAGRQ